MAQYTFDLGGKGHIYTVEADSQDEGFALAVDRDHQKYRGVQSQIQKSMDEGPPDFLSKVSQSIFPEGVAAKAKQSLKLNPFSGPGKLPATLPKELGGEMPPTSLLYGVPPPSMLYNMLPKTPGQIAATGASAAVSGGLGAAATMIPRAMAGAKAARTLAMPAIGEIGLQVQKRVPALFGEETEKPSALEHALAVLAPAFAERFLAKPALKSPVQTSRELGKAVGVPEKNLEMFGAQAPGKLTRPIYERLQKEGIVPSSTRYEDFLVDTAAAIKGEKIEPLLARRGTQRAAVESAQDQIAFRREKLKALNQERKAVSRRELTEVEKEQVPAIQAQRDEIARLQNLKLDAPDRETAKEIQKELNLTRAPLPPGKEEAVALRGQIAAPKPTKDIQNVVDELKTLRSSRRSARQNITRIDQDIAKYKADISNINNLKTAFRRSAEASGDPNLGKVLARAKDSDEFVSEVFHLPPEEWESLNAFMTPTERSSLQEAFGQYFVKEAYDPNTTYLGQAGKIFDDLGWEKVQRIYPGKVGEIRQLVGDLRTLAKPNAAMEALRASTVIGPGRHAFLAFRGGVEALQALTSPNKFINSIIANPQLGEQFHTFATKGATPALLATLPALRQWFENETTELPSTKKNTRKF